MVDIVLRVELPSVLGLATALHSLHSPTTGQLAFHSCSWRKVIIILVIAMIVIIIAVVVVVVVVVILTVPSAIAIILLSSSP